MGRTPPRVQPQGHTVPLAVSHGVCPAQCILKGRGGGGGGGGGPPCKPKCLGHCRFSGGSWMDLIYSGMVPGTSGGLLVKPSVVRFEPGCSLPPGGTTTHNNMEHSGNNRHVATHTKAVMVDTVWAPKGPEKLFLASPHSDFQMTWEGGRREGGGSKGRREGGSHPSHLSTQTQPRSTPLASQCWVVKAPACGSNQCSVWALGAIKE